MGFWGRSIGVGVRAFALCILTGVAWIVAVAATSTVLIFLYVLFPSKTLPQLVIILPILFWGLLQLLYNGPPNPYFLIIEAPTLAVRQLLPKFRNFGP